MSTNPDLKARTWNHPAWAAMILLAATTTLAVPPASAGNCWDSKQGDDASCDLDCEAGAGVSISVSSQNQGNVHGSAVCPGAIAVCPETYAYCSGSSGPTGTGGPGHCYGHADNGDVTVGCASGGNAGTAYALALIRDMVASGAECLDVSALALRSGANAMAFVASTWQSAGFTWSSARGCSTGSWDCHALGSAVACELGSTTIRSQ